MPQQDSSIAVVSTVGTHLDRTSVDALAEQVRSARAGGASRIVVEGSSLKVAEHDGLAALLAWAAQERQRGGSPIALAELSPALLLAVCQTRLQRDVDVYCTRQAAVRDLETR